MPKSLPQLEVVDNVDPQMVSKILLEGDIHKTHWFVISKSGNTLETLAPFSLLLEQLKRHSLSVADCCTIVTDPVKGPLRDYANRNGIPCLGVPSNVGGRYSVFTPVGLAPLFAVGYDVKALVSGACWAFENEMHQRAVRNLSRRIFELECSGVSTHVLMPYASTLRDLGAWFVQLWGESLGKSVGGKWRCGQAPLAAVGATDQHSLLQWLQDGPDQSMTGFVRIKSFRSGPTHKIPKLPQEFAAVDYFSGKTLEEILWVEALGTEQALQQFGKPTYSLTLPELSPECMGALLATLMDLTVWTGAYLAAKAKRDVGKAFSPFDQPGVEHGKKLFPALMNHKN